MSLDVLQAKIRKLKNPMAISLDLREALIPPEILGAAGSLPQAYEIFGKGILDALQEVVPAAKFQTAYFEALGGDGLTVLKNLCAYAREKGYYVILETMQCALEPAAAQLAPAFFAEDGLYQADAVSLCAFAGSDGVKPFLPYCKAGKGLFVLAKTQNKSSREVQDLISGDRVIYTVMTDLAVRWGGELIGKSGYAEIGVSVGATHPTVLAQLREKYDRLFFLVPGYGELGGGAKDVQYAFDKFGHGALAAVADPILAAWVKSGEPAEYLTKAREAAIKLRAELAAYVLVM